MAAGTYSIPSGQPCDAALPCGGRGLSGGAIAGIVVGVIVGVALLVIVAVWWWWRRKGNRWGKKW